MCVKKKEGGGGKREKERKGEMRGIISDSEVSERGCKLREEKINR